VSQDPGFNQSNVNVSNALVYSLIAAPVGLYTFGYWDKDQHAKEAGLLARRLSGMELF